MKGVFGPAAGASIGKNVVVSSPTINTITVVRMAAPDE